MDKLRRIEFLFQKYLESTISVDEMREMLDHFDQFGIPPEIDTLMHAEFAKPTPTDEYSDIKDAVEQRLVAHLAKNSRKTRILPLWAAASVVFAVLIGAFLLITPQNPWRPMPEQLAAGDAVIAPASNKATIELPDGQVIALDENRGGIAIESGRISYEGVQNPIHELRDDQSVQLITVKTPRGGTYQVRLPDGTEVWLNAETSLKYPSRFNKDERVVHLEGEAYFAVKRTDADLPFKVVSAGQTVEVLGTTFNISAYPEEKAMKTTLINGKVTVHQTYRQEFLTLQPGQQAQVDGIHMKKVEVDVNDHIDWKNGEFVFRGETAKETLRRIARWYDVDVDYQDNTSEERYSGSISRYDDIQTVLDIMREAGELEFKIKDRTVVVSKKPASESIR